MLVNIIIGVRDRNFVSAPRRFGNEAQEADIGTDILKCMTHHMQMEPSARRCRSWIKWHPFNAPFAFPSSWPIVPFPKPTLYRFVQTLTNQGMLAFDAERQTYSMGLRLVRLAHAAWRHSSLASVARPFIEALAEEIGEAIHLAQIDHGHVLFVDKYKATDKFDTLAQAGKIAPGYCTGVGKVIPGIHARGCAKSRIG
jgi:hypothetical protein